VKDGAVEATERYFRNGCFVRETVAKLDDIGPARAFEAGCMGGRDAVKKAFQNADRCAAKAGLVPAGDAVPRRSPPGPDDDQVDVVLVLGDSTRWRGRDREAAADLAGLLKALGNDKDDEIEDWAAPAPAPAAVRGLQIGADGRALSPPSRAVQIIAGIDVTGRWRCGRVVPEATGSVRRRIAPPRPITPRNAARMVERLLAGVSAETVAAGKDAAPVSSPYGAVTVEVTLDASATGRLPAPSALDVAARFATEGTSLSPLCAIISP
jgi:hypothetical protein